MRVYMKCNECDRVAAMLGEHGSCPHCGARDSLESIEVHPVGTAAELAYLRGVRDRLKDEDLVLAYSESCECGTHYYMDLYRKAVLGEPTS